MVTLLKVVQCQPIFKLSIFETKTEIKEFVVYLIWPSCAEGPRHLVVVVGAEEDGDEGQPDDAGGVHGEPDVPGHNRKLLLLNYYKHFFNSTFKNVLCISTIEYSLLLGLIEVLWNLPGLEGVYCAEDDEEHVVEEGHDDGEGGDGAGLQGGGRPPHRVQEDDL